LRPALEVADIFRRHGPAYRHAHADHLGGTERRVMAAIEACRTPVLGGHVEHCLRIPTKPPGSSERFPRTVPI
jgi:hypothetical protein